MDSIVTVKNHNYGIKTYSSKKFEDINPNTVNFAKVLIDEIEILKNASTIIKQKIKYEKIRMNLIIDTFIKDTVTKDDKRFRCWVLPNGTIYAQDKNYAPKLNHGRFVDIFFEGLKEYNEQLYNEMIELYQEYHANVGKHANVQESFAVEELGWMQVSSNNMYNYVAYRGENWQDKLLWPLFTDYDFKFLISKNRYCHDSKFFQLYDNIDEIIDLGLEKSKKLIKK